MDNVAIATNTTYICFIYACTDEIHQYFVPGRAFELVDIGLDTLGSVIAAAVLLIILKHQKSVSY